MSQRLPDERFEFDAFLSHSSLDKEVVRQIAQRLTQGGLRVWLDEWEIKPGDNILTKIEAGLKASRTLVLCISKHGQGSEWAALESQTFRYRDPLNKEGRYLALLLDDTKPEGTLEQFKHVDWHKNPDIACQSLLAACVPAPCPGQAAPGEKLDRLLGSLGAPGDQLLTLLGQRPSIMGRAVSGHDLELDALFALHAETWREALLAQLEKLDRSLHWLPERYVELEAEVEEQDARGQTRSIRDLGTALLRHRKHRVILLLGDPGSGKSVGLRKLARDLLTPNELRRSGRLPLYLNLRDWPTPAGWVEGSALEPEEVTAHLTAWAAEQCAWLLGESEGFTLAVFQRLLDQGRLFLLLDSFDEIPAALDAHERGRLLGILSTGLHRFIHGHLRTLRRGIIASRIYRRPVKSFASAERRGPEQQQGFETDCTLTVRPLTDGRLLRFIANHLHGRSDLGERLLRERPGLAAAARNPFTAMLVVSFIHARLEEGLNVLPSTREECYREAFRTRFQKIQASAAEHRILLTEEDLWRGLKTFARAIFDDQGSFDLPASHLQQVWPLLAEEPAAAEVLCSHALLRRGTAQRTLGFSHRRLAEYLAALTLPHEVSALPLEHILTANGRWRDALVVWCEVAPLDCARDLAERCWASIDGDVAAGLLPQKAPGQDADEEEEENAITVEESVFIPARMFVLRFLIEGYRGRLVALDSIHEDLGLYLFRRIRDDDTDLLTCKRLGEAACLLQGQDLSDVLWSVLKRDSRWVTTETLSNCRFQVISDNSTADALADFIHRLSFRELFKSDGLMFSLRLSPGLAWMRREVFYRLADWVWFIFWSILIAVCLPKDGFLFVRLAWGLVLFISILNFIARIGLRSEIMGRLVFFVVVSFAEFLRWKEIEYMDSKLQQWYLGRHAHPVFNVLAGFLALPFLQVVATRRVFRQTTQYVGSIVLLYGISFAIIFAVLRLIQSFGQASRVTPGEVLLRIIYLSFGVSILISIFNHLLVPSCHALRDRRRFRSVPKQLGSDLTRADVAHWLSVLKSQRYQIRYLKRIDEQGILPSGRWPGDKLPVTKHAAVNDRLAQLEEHWQDEELRVQHERERLSGSTQGR